MSVQDDYEVRIKTLREKLTDTEKKYVNALAYNDVLLREVSGRMVDGERLHSVQNWADELPQRRMCRCRSEVKRILKGETT